jgi:hypothetical protein
VGVDERMITEHWWDGPGWGTVVAGRTPLNHKADMWATAVEPNQQPRHNRQATHIPNQGAALWVAINVS